MRIVHGTLTPGQVATHTLDSYTAQITILNRTRTGEIYFTVDGTTPGVRGNDSYVCLGSRAVAAINPMGTTTVKLIADTAIDYSVTGETS